MNVSLARKLLQHLAVHGVQEICLCAGARNAPFVELLSKVTGLKVFSFFDERSASFFALGRIKASAKPVAVVTTSGTAVAELLPATVEAHYSGLPLVLVTADRPKSYRGTGAPQSIEQSGIFTSYVAASFDLDCWQELPAINRSAPVHVNVCFDEPLIDEEIEPWKVEATDLMPSSLSRFTDSDKLTEFFANSKSPLLILGPMSGADRQSVENWIGDWKGPVYAEGASGLRTTTKLQNLLCSGDKFLSSKFCKDKFDGVLRIGGVPTLRFWRDLEANELPVLSLSSVPMSGLSRNHFGVIDLAGAMGWLGNHTLEIDVKWAEEICEEDQRRAAGLRELVACYPLAEPSWFFHLSQQINESGNIFVGNSLSIREWDLCAEASKSQHVHCNRGANGIDGLVSTFLGVAEGKDNCCVLGDLSAVYDLSALWASHLRKDVKTQVVVINNGGGKIFSRIFNNQLFENRHSLNFKPWAEMFDFNYLRVDEPEQFQRAEGNAIIEVVPSAEQTEKFWQGFEGIHS